MQEKTQPRPTTDRVSMGIPGLDEILKGGLVQGDAYLVRGGPGSGKTILGFHFLTAGTSPDKSALFISLIQSEASLRDNARSLGFSLPSVAFLDLSPSAEYFAENQAYDIFSPAEVEREPTTKAIMERVEELRPDRIFIDGMTHFRYLSPDPFQYRRQVIALLHFLEEQGATVVFSSEHSEDAPDADLQFLSDGVIQLDSLPDGRTITVTKFRGSGFLGGEHTMRLTDRGMQIAPRLLPGRHGREFTAGQLPSGVPELDALIHGGLERGTVTIVTGPAGVGKTTLGAQFVKEAAARSERSVIYLFEEARETFLRRSESIGTTVHAMMQSGMLAVMEVEPVLYTPDEFAGTVRAEVEERGARIVMIDSMAGYRLSIRGGDLVRHLHALSTYLKNMGVTVILINPVEMITGDFRVSDVGISYLADNIVFLRYLEIDGELRKAIGVLKKRMSDFERTLREFSITGQGIVVGEPLRGLRGILRGMPEWVAPPPRRKA